MKRRPLHIFLLLLTVALAACAGEVNLLDETKLQDTSLLSGDPCEAPCWNGITPGETTYRDAKLILGSDNRYKISDESEAEGEEPGRVFSFAEGENQPCCQMISRDGETISSFMLQLAPQISFGPAFDKFGEPRYIIGQAVSEEQAYAVSVYPEAPMVIYAFVAGGEQGNVSVDNKIIALSYMAPSEMQHLLTCARLHEWKGFVSLATYAGAEEFDYVGSGVGDEKICPEG
ncbi:MAG: hypothetical protein OXG23_07405 [Chloroflexi bacterium]|nr:hypothetical protein [Chloroflexota bacterium]